MQRPALGFAFFAFYASVALNRVVLARHRSEKYLPQTSDRARRHASRDGWRVIKSHGTFGVGTLNFSYFTRPGLGIARFWPGIGAGNIFRKKATAPAGMRVATGGEQ